MGECNHRYDLVGERLGDRQGEMEKTLADLKSYLIDVQQLMVYLNRAEPTVRFYTLVAQTVMSERYFHNHM